MIIIYMVTINNIIINIIIINIIIINIINTVICRTHQLRIHLASIDHPILGDLFYAPRSVYLESSRLLLHAEELGLVHPRTNQPLRFLAKCPFSLYDNLQSAAEN